MHADRHKYNIIVLHLQVWEITFNQKPEERFLQMQMNWPQRMMEKGHIMYLFKLTIYSAPFTIITIFTQI
jgi:hypothetical protein